MNKQTIELDLSKSSYNNTVLSVAQGDAGGLTIEALIYDNGAEVDLEGHDVWLVAKLPDRRHYYKGACTVDGNKAVHVVDESKLCSVKGYTDEVYFEVDRELESYSTERFAVEILGSAIDGSNPAENWDNEIDAIIKRGRAYLVEAEKSEQDRNTAETARIEAEKTRVSAEAARGSAETKRASAEAARISAETKRAEAEIARASAETARGSAETKRADAEKARVAAETKRAEDQTKNNADQAANNAAAQGLQVVLLASGQYDETTRKPKITGEIGKLYFVPSAQSSETDAYIEWMWIGSAWERVGMSNATVVGLTTSEIDKAASGQSLTSESVLNGSGLSYLWTKIKAAFAAAIHKHSASDITSGTLSADRIGAGSVTTAKLADSSVTPAKIKPASIGTSLIEDEAVTKDKLGSDVWDSISQVISDGVLAYKCAGIVTVVVLNKSITLEDYWSKASLGILPEGMRPAHEISSPVSLSEYVASARLVIEINGSISIQNMSGANPPGTRTAYACVSFPAA